MEKVLFFAVGGLAITAVICFIIAKIIFKKRIWIAKELILEKDDPETVNKMTRLVKKIYFYNEDYYEEIKELSKNFLIDIEIKDGNVEMVQVKSDRTTVSRREPHTITTEYTGHTEKSALKYIFWELWFCPALIVMILSVISLFFVK